MQENACLTVCMYVAYISNVKAENQLKLFCNKTTEQPMVFLFCSNETFGIKVHVI